NMGFLSSRLSKLTALFPFQEEFDEVKVSPDWKTILTMIIKKEWEGRTPKGTVEVTFQLWKAATGDPIGQPIREDFREAIRNHRHIGYTGFFSPDGKSLVTRTTNGTRLWNASTGKLLRKLDSNGQFKPAWEANLPLSGPAKVRWIQTSANGKEFRTASP